MIQGYDHGHIVEASVFGFSILILIGGKVSYHESLRVKILKALLLHILHFHVE